MMWRSVFLGALVFISAAPAHAAEFYLRPSGMHMHNVRAVFDKDHCGNSAPTLNRTGISPVSPPVEQYRQAGEFGLGMVGYTNRLEKGSDPFPCDRWNLTAVQMAFKFNLRDVRRALQTPDALAGAFLSFEPRPMNMGHVPDYAERRPYQACPAQGLVVGRAASDPSGGFTEAVVRECGDVFRPGCIGRADRLTASLLQADDPVTPRATPVEEARPGTLAPDADWPLRHSIRVTPILLGWIDESSDHLWFVLSPPTPPAMSENAGRIAPPRGNTWFLNCWRVFKDIRLRVVIDE